MSAIQIKTHGSTAELYVDGIPVGRRCTRYSLTQDGGSHAILVLEFDSIDIEVSGDAEVKINASE